jgi:outer membrane protein TolC
MKIKTGIITSIVLLAFVIAAAPLSAGTLKDLFTAATQSNQDYSVYTLDLELAQLKKTKGEIEAKVELDRISAQNSYTSALASYRRSVLSFYNEVIDAAFAAATAELDLEYVGLSMQNAKVDKDYADTRFKNGLISEDVYKEIQIAYKTVSNNYDLAAWTFLDAKNVFFLATGREWDSSLLPEAPDFSFDASMEDWLSKDTSLEIARLAVKIQELKTALLATNASAYDKRIQETENLKAKVSLSNAESDAKRSFESMNITLRNQAALLQIRSDEYVLEESSFQDALRQYEKGIISQSDKNQKAMTLLTVRKNLLSARKNYIKSIGSSLSALGENPLGL